jgi:5-methyltetrahydropteroyltriglutamate--homocysteine methyltransferase
MIAMRIPTEPIGSIPRPLELIEGMTAHAAGTITDKELNHLFEAALVDTIHRFELTGSPVITDGEQTKPSFATYPIAGYPKLDPNGVVIPFADGHTRQLPKLTGGPFHYQTFASSYLQKAKTLTALPVKQAVIAVSALSLLYPAEGIQDYSRDQFIADLLTDAEADIRKCLEAGAYNVQIDFTEARLALKLDPSGGLLQAFIDLNNQVLSRFSPTDRSKIGVHSCPGGDHDSTHSADIPYAQLLPYLFQLKATNFYLEYAGEGQKLAVLDAIKSNLKPYQVVFIGVTDVLNPKVESPQDIRETIMEAASVIPQDQLGTTDDCGFSPFADDVSTARDVAFEKIRSRVEGTRLAELALNRTSVAL